MSWSVEIYPSGTTLVTDGRVALYVHSIAELIKTEQPLTDAERYKAACIVRDKLNSITPILSASQMEPST